MGKGEKPIRVLVVCTHNAARSQMAEALLRWMAGEAVEVYSAGTEPTAVHPLTIRVLEELGIHTGGLRAKSVEEFLGQTFDYVITVCDQARERCPVFPGGEQIHWSFPDPAAVEGNEEEKLEAFRQVRDALAQRLRLWVSVTLRDRQRGPVTHW
ncbi:arsenate reductase ArsC [Thermomicrobium sp. CFH 73360]|uniref:arsenate reductase ArsC n=1 Tax=Thermomicrobium sp. CFH 73360 TaxID=2951987 RepID=UPI00336BBC3B